MQLTNQMLAETESIETRVHRIAIEILKPMLFEEALGELGIETRNRKIRAIIAELNPYKVRLENLLCETDIKEQAHSHQNQVIRFSNFLVIRTSLISTLSCIH